MSPDPVACDGVARLESALKLLPRLQREIFLAVSVDGLGYDEVAARTGLGAREIERLFALSLRRILDAVEGRPREPLRARLVRWRARLVRGR